MKKTGIILLVAILSNSCNLKTSDMDLPEIDAILTSQVEKNKTPSVQYIIFDKENVIYRFQDGFANIKGGKEADVHTTYNAYSITKTFTALAILQLAEKRKLNLDDAVKQYLSEFSYSADITIRQLMTHTSGIPNPIPLSWVHLEEEHQTFDRNEFFEEIFRKYNKTKSNPNEKFGYSNLGFIFLGDIIEEVSGEPYENYIRDNILQPLGIGSEELDFEIIDRNQLAKGYQKRNSFINLVLGFFMDKSKYMDKAEGMWKPFKNMYINGSPYGGLIGNPNGFQKYIQELLKPDCLLLSDDHKEMLFTENFTNDEKATGMCLSWFRGSLNGQEYFTHAGGGGGYYCEIRIYPKPGIGSVIMFNRSGMKDERFLDKLDVYYLKRD